jgi:hypothetical protein
MAKNNDIDLARRLELLALIEFAKAGADRTAVRTIMGSLDNNLYSKLKTLLEGRAKK